MFELESFFWLAIIVAVSALYTRLRKKVSSNYLERKLQQLDTHAYQVLSHVRLPDLDQALDHVIVSVYGVFVIRRENYNGFIYGQKDDQEWTCELKKKKSKFSNPIIENEANVKKLSEQLKLEDKYIESVIAFANTAHLEVDQALIKNHHVTNYDQIVEAIKSWHTPRLSKDKVQALAQQLKG